MATPPQTHQPSSQAFLAFLSLTVLEPGQSSRATEIFNRLVARYEPVQAVRPYKHVTFLRAFHETAIGKDHFLGSLLSFLDANLRPGQDGPEPNFAAVLSRLDDVGSWTGQRSIELQLSIIAFSDHIMDNFFIPLKASGRKTPQSTPASHSTTQIPIQASGSTPRLAGLREQCLSRDHYKCVISHKFDLTEALERWHRDGPDFRDDEGNFLTRANPEDLEIARIVPLSFMSLSAGPTTPPLSDSKKSALRILNMLNPGIGDLIGGPDIDRVTNAITLTLFFYQRFEDFEVSFVPTADGVPHSYKIDYIDPNRPYHDPLLPVNRQLWVALDNAIDAPSPQLLAVHHAIARIIYLSRVRGYIDHVVQRTEEVVIRRDGSSQVGRYVGLKIGGWLEAVPI